MKTFVVLLGVLFLFVSCEQFEKQEKKLSKEKKFELSERCAKSGKIYFDDFWRGNNISAVRYQTEYSWDDPEYHYSEKLNTCLIHIRYMEFDRYQSAITRHYNQVVDIFSNRTIIRGWFKRDVANDKFKEDIIDLQDGVPNYTSVKYYEEKKKLFSE